MSDNYKSINYNNCKVGNIKAILKDVPDEYNFVFLGKGVIYSQNVLVDIDHNLSLVTIKVSDLKKEKNE